MVAVDLYTDLDYTGFSDNTMVEGWKVAVARGVGVHYSYVNVTLLSTTVSSSSRSLRDEISPRALYTETKFRTHVAVPLGRTETSVVQAMVGITEEVSSLHQTLNGLRGYEGVIV